MSSFTVPHLLVPTNFRPAARRARQRALQLAVKEARVTLLHVLPTPDVWKPKSGMDALELLHDVMRLPADDARCAPTLPAKDEMRRRAWQRLVRELHPEWRESVDIALALRSGNVLEQILKHIAEEQVDAIVLGLRRSRLPRLIPGLTDRILRRAPCEVILVSDARPPHWNSLIPLRALGGAWGWCFPRQ